jgi:cytochrome c oxidase subunit 3
VPPLLWVNTAVLVASGGALEWARAAGRRADLEAVRSGLGAAAAFGAAFLGGQWLAWRGLIDAGISMATGPHSAFFYLLTGAHALHVAGGVLALLYVYWRARQATRAADAAAMLYPAAIYWHFVDVLWLYVFFLLFV